MTHLLDGLQTVPVGRGLFLGETYRMHPLITEYTSDLFYEGKLRSVGGLERQEALADGLPAGFEWLAGSGLRWVPVEHEGRTNASDDEARKVVEIVSALVGRGWVDSKGVARPKAFVRFDERQAISAYGQHP